MTNNESTNFRGVKERLLGMVTAAGVLVCLATVLGFLGRFWWFFDLFSHFRVQYLLALVILGVALLPGRFFKTAVVFFVFAATNLGTVLPLYFGAQPAASDSSHKMRVMLLNASANTGNVERIIETVQNVEPDILLLEEITSKMVDNMQPILTSYEHVWLEPRADNFGIGMFSDFKLKEKKIVNIGKADVPSMLATVESPEGDFRIIGTHTLPPGGARYSRLRNDHLEELPRYTDSPLPTILVGDLNVTPWSFHFRKLVEDSGLRNSMRGRGVQPTWPTRLPFFWIPLDHFLHSSDITIMRRAVGPNVGSDHYPIIVDFCLRKQNS